MCITNVTIKRHGSSKWT